MASNRRISISEQNDIERRNHLHIKCHGRSRIVASSRARNKGGQQPQDNKSRQYALKNSYDSQHNALLGMCVTTRGVRPLKNPRSPSRRQMIPSAPSMPRQYRISGTVEVPRVCKSVFATSRGVVRPAATPPATPPATMCAKGEYSPRGFINFFTCSYTVNWAAVKGTVMVSVVGYET